MKRRKCRTEKDKEGRKSFAGDACTYVFTEQPGPLFTESDTTTRLPYHEGSMGVEESTKRGLVLSFSLVEPPPRE